MGFPQAHPNYNNVHVYYRSGTEEEYDELAQLLQDILDYQNDFEERRAEEHKSVTNRKSADKKKGQDMRKAALEGMSSMLIFK